MALQGGGNANDWFLLAMAHWQKGDKDEACKWFDKAVARTKEQGPRTLIHAGSGRKRRWTPGQPGPDADGAGPSAAPAAEGAAADPAQARLRRGPHHPRHRPESPGKPDEAVAAYRRAIRLKPTSPVPTTALASC